MTDGQVGNLWVGTVEECVEQFIILDLTFPHGIPHASVQMDV